MSLGQQLAPHLPFLRRYGRALTGSQMHGDKYVRATLEAIVAAPEEFPRDVDPRLGLYRMFQAIWNSANFDEVGDEGFGEAEGHEAVARARLARMTPLSRQALLLTAMEGFTPEDAAYLIEVDTSEVEAHRKLFRSGQHRRKGGGALNRWRVIRKRAPISIMHDPMVMACAIEMHLHVRCLSAEHEDLVIDGQLATSADQRLD